MRLYSGVLVTALGMAGMACWSPPDDRTPAPAPPPLRVICQPRLVAYLPRAAEPADIDRELAVSLAEELGRPLQLEPMESLTAMLQRLRAGEADMIIASLTVTEARRRQVAFSLPYLHTEELLIVRRETPVLQELTDLDGREVCVRAASAHAESLQKVQQSVPRLQIRHLPPDIDSQEAIDLVEQGACWATVADGHLWSAIRAGYEGLHVGLTLAKDRAIAVALPRDQQVLRRRINDFLISRAFTRHRETIFTRDLPGLKQRGRLRMITRNNALTYFLHRGKPLGFEYELMRRFAASQGLRLEIVIPPGYNDLITWLKQGRGDVIAAGLTVTESRAERVLFTRPYLHVDHVVAVREQDPVKTRVDLAGRTIYIRRSSSYTETVADLKVLVPEVTVIYVPEDMETEEILAKVESGEYDLTVCASHLLDLERTWGRRLRAALSLRPTELAWAVRPSSAKLLAALNSYLDREYRGLHYNLWKERYFGDPKQIAKARDSWRSDISGRISDYDEQIRRGAAANDLDWRLVAALIHQESGFNPNRRSWAGALGLLQLMPATARSMGATNPDDPEQAVLAGCRLLRHLIDQFETTLPVATRIRFALAAYNAGLGHLRDARRLAQRQGLSPDRWYGGVEQAMLLLEQPRYHQTTRYGYCRGSESVRYVREIEERYRIYIKHLAAYEQQVTPQPQTSPTVQTVPGPQATPGQQPTPGQQTTPTPQITPEPQASPH